MMHYGAKRGLAIACRLSVCDIGGLWSHGLQILETNCTDNWPNSFTDIAYSEENRGNFWETKNLIKKTLLSLTLVRLCEETREARIYRAHRVVIFAIAQISCYPYLITLRVYMFNRGLVWSRRLMVAQQLLQQIHSYLIPHHHAEMYSFLHWHQIHRVGYGFHHLQVSCCLLYTILSATVN